MRAHYVHEPDHISNAKVCTSRYLDVFPEHCGLLQEGMQAYLGLYQRMFQQLDARIFG
jgi:hypothetical protein